MKLFTVKSASLLKHFALLFLGFAAAGTNAGIYVSGSTVYENGSPFVMRGVNVAHAWYKDNTNSSLTAIANTGANSVRVVLASGKLWTRTPESEVASIISQAKASKLITVLEVHDTTGYGEQNAASLNEAVDYWISIKNALIGQEDYVIINIGNEPFGNGPSASAWTDGHKNAISRLRAAGFKHALMVDAANWGQDWQNIMRDNAASVLASDPQKNVMFSVHMYEVYGSASSVNNYMTSFKNNGLALVVGEFAADHFGKNVDEGAIMSYARQHNYGYFGWSWSGNGSGLTSLDVVQNFNAGSLTTWGNTLINGANGIKATSNRATIFGGTSSSSSSAGHACGTAPNGYPYCCSANSATGSGWGWENNRSCVVRTTSSTCNWYGTSYPICTSVSSGWGWENNRSCISQSTCSTQ